MCRGWNMTSSFILTWYPKVSTFVSGRYSVSTNQTPSCNSYIVTRLVTVGAKSCPSCMMTHHYVWLGQSSRQKVLSRITNSFNFWVVHIDVRKRVSDHYLLLARPRVFWSSTKHVNKPPTPALALPHKHIGKRQQGSLERRNNVFVRCKLVQTIIFQQQLMYVI